MKLKLSNDFKERLAVLGKLVVLIALAGIFGYSVLIFQIETLVFFR